MEMKWRLETRAGDEMRWNEMRDERWEMRDESLDERWIDRCYDERLSWTLDECSMVIVVEGRRFSYTYVHTRACAYRCIHMLHTLGAHYTYTRRAHYVRARFLLNDFIKVWLKFNSDFNRNFSSVKTWYELLKFN